MLRVQFRTVGMHQLPQRRLFSSTSILCTTPPPPSPPQAGGNGGGEGESVPSRRRAPLQPTPHQEGGRIQRLTARIRGLGQTGYIALGALSESMSQTSSQFAQSEAHERHGDKNSMGTWRTPAKTTSSYGSNEEEGSSDNGDKHQNIVLLGLIILGVVGYVLHYLTYAHVQLTTRPDDMVVSMFDHLGTDYAYFQRRYLVRFSLRDIPLLPSILDAIQATQPYKCIASTFSRNEAAINESKQGGNVTRVGVQGSTVFMSGGRPELPCYRHASDYEIQVVRDPHTNQHTKYRHRYNRLLYKIIPFRTERSVGFVSTLGEVLRENMIAFQTHGRLEKSDMFDKLAGAEDIETAYWSKPRQKIVDAGGADSKLGKIDVSVSVRPYSGKDVMSEQILQVRIQESFNMALKIRVFEAVRALSLARQTGGKEGGSDASQSSVRSEKRRLALTDQMIRSGAISSLDLTSEDLLVFIANNNLEKAEEGISRELVERAQNRLAEDLKHQLDKRSHEEYLISKVEVKIRT